MSVLGSLAFLLGALGASPEAPQTVDGALMKQARGVMRYIRAHGYRNVGVLKFRVKRGDEPTSDRVGLLNLSLATRLEIALILVNDPRDPIGMTHDASAVAATLPGANHLKAEGRKALFRGRYPLAWGRQEVTPDAFLTGVAILDRDLRHMRVSIQAFDSRGGPIEEVALCEATTDPPALVEAGESFLIRGVSDPGHVESPGRPTASQPHAPSGPELADAQVMEAATRVRTSQQANPLQDRAAPVGLEVYYDDQPVPIEFRGGKAFVREPGEGQRVQFVLRKRDTSPERFGVVLTVNGENTLQRERRAPIDCWKWILSPETPAVRLLGYHRADGTVEVFRVLSRADSEARAIDYGTDVGTITLVVFRERKGPPTGQPLDDDAEDVAAVGRGSFPAQPPSNLAALSLQLRQPNPGGSRGMISEGARLKAGVRVQTFLPADVPIMSCTITYYDPKK